MRVLTLIAEFKEGNTIALNLWPVDMDDDPDAFDELAQYALEADALAEAEVEGHGKKFVAIYDAKAIGKWKPPVVHTTDGEILQGRVMLALSYGMGRICGLSNDDEEFLRKYLPEHIQEMAPLLTKHSK